MDIFLFVRDLLRTPHYEELMDHLEGKRKK